MGSCRSVSIHTAEMLAFDANMRAATRFEAMSLLITTYAPPARGGGARAVVAELLSIRPEDPTDRYHKAGLVASAIFDDALWRGCIHEIRSALAELCELEGVPQAGALITRSDCKSAIGLTHRPVDRLNGSKRQHSTPELESIQDASDWLQSHFSIEHSGKLCQFELTFDTTGSAKILTGAQVYINGEHVTDPSNNDSGWEECIKRHPQGTAEAFIAAAKEYVDRRYPRRGTQ